MQLSFLLLDEAKTFHQITAVAADGVRGRAWLHNECAMNSTYVTDGCFHDRFYTNGRVLPSGKLFVA